MSCVCAEVRVSAGRSGPLSVNGGESTQADCASVVPAVAAEQADDRLAARRGQRSGRWLVRAERRGTRAGRTASPVRSTCPVARRPLRFRWPLSRRRRVRCRASGGRGAPACHHRRHRTQPRSRAWQRAPSRAAPGPMGRSVSSHFLLARVHPTTRAAAIPLILRVRLQSPPPEETVTRTTSDVSSSSPSFEVALKTAR